MKKRMISLLLAVMMCMGLCTGAFAAEEKAYTEQIWDVALAWNEAPCIGSKYKLTLTGDFTSDVHEGSFGLSCEGTEYVYADGHTAAWTPIRITAPSQYSFNAETIVVPDGGRATYWVGAEPDDEEPTLYQGTGDEDIAGDPNQLVLLFAQIGDEKLEVQAAQDGGSTALSFELSGEALKNVVDAMCHPILMGGFGQSAKWDAITAQMTVTLDGDGDNSAEITLDSPSLAEALICALEGVQSAENAQLTITDSVDTYTEEDSDYAAHYFTPEIIQSVEDEAGGFTDWTGGEPEKLSILEAMDAAYRPSWEELTGRESAKDALRDQLAAGAEDNGAG